MPRRREWKRQEHAHQGRCGRLSGRSRRAHRLFRGERCGADSAAGASQGRGGDLAGPGAFPGNDGRGEHRVRWPRGRAATRELPRHARDGARRARQAGRGAQPWRPPQESAHFRQTIGGDCTRARERCEAHLHGRAHRLAHAGRDGPPARGRAHALRVRRRRGLREPSARGSARRVEPRHRLARRTNGWRVRRRGHDTVAVDGTDDRQTL